MRNEVCANIIAQLTITFYMSFTKRVQHGGPVWPPPVSGDPPFFRSWPDDRNRARHLDLMLTCLRCFFKAQTYSTCIHMYICVYIYICMYVCVYACVFKNKK